VGAFTVETKEKRLKVSWQGRFITAFNQGKTRNYLYPVYTPAGQAVTSEVAVDHPHHPSIWIAAEKVNGYNLYVEDTYEGRAPGSIRQVSVAWEEQSATTLHVVQQLEWRGPRDWTNPDGALLLKETRTTEIEPGEAANRLTVRSHLTPGGGPVTIGPTKHSYFGIRLADPIHVTQGGTLVDASGSVGEEQIFEKPADWVDYHGKLAFGKVAGVGILPDASFDGVGWFARNYGSVCVSTMRHQAVRITAEQPLDQTVRFVVHDGDHKDADIAGEYRTFRQRG